MVYRPQKCTTAEFICLNNEWFIFVKGMTEPQRIKKDWIPKLKQYEWRWHETMKRLYARPMECNLTWDEVAHRENLNKEI